ncbi:hypothetical protein WT81_20675 [Burkholderia stagnalis]|nr:hypothetical protein WT80_19435 [Burkholderia stagnalis]KWK56444.1 hypothetical protein WT81_20675 [Burkholderia stagnalis]KWN67734.1 hypothetical protein WT90_27765 [Burkholderia stagnalis]
MLVAGKLHDHRAAPTPFDAIQLKETFELVMQFMRRDVTEKLSNPAHARLLDTMETAVLALEPAAGVFSKWPSGFLEQPTNCVVRSAPVFDTLVDQRVHTLSISKANPPSLDGRYGRRVLVSDLGSNLIDLSLYPRIRVGKAVD